MSEIIFEAVLFHLFSALSFAYIDPGSGLPFLSLGPIIIAGLLGFLAGFFLLIKKFFHFFRKHFLLILLILAGIVFVIGGIIMRGCIAYPKKIVIIGMDALDYSLIGKFMGNDELPNFKRLKKSGVFYPLETVCPPESNVVWTSFATGMNPGNHGIFDFIMRDPKTYFPYLSLVNISSPTQNFKAGPFKFPLLKPKVSKTRKSPAFWEITSKNKIPSYTYFCPGSFPPDKVYGKLISGMGVPDIRGTMGTFSFYTTRPLEKDKYIGGLVFHVEKDGNIVNTHLYGPRNSSKNPPEDIRVPLRIEILDSHQIVIKIQGERIYLQKDGWSKWVPLLFRINRLTKVKGICKFYLKSVTPEFELYCSPVNFDPRNPLFSISYPKGLSKKLAKEVGLFYTQGMPYDTWALNEKRINKDIFLKQANTVLKERERIFKKELLSFQGGIFFFYFEYPDPIQHMFWCCQDIESSPYKSVVLNSYKKMDSILGWTMANIDKETTLIVLSDHGFGSFKRAVHLNSWLKNNGFLYLKRSKKKCKEFFADVDWSRTRAYALGFGGIYINQIGREAQGIVSSGTEKDKVKKEIIDKLSRWQDPKTKDSVIKKVHTKEEVFKGKFNQNAPDLFVGFNKGYRASWQTALGGVPIDSIEDNLKAWSADHIFDPSLVDGVLFINKKINLQKKPKIIDITPTILKLLDINCKKLDGNPLL